MPWPLNPKYCLLLIQTFTKSCRHVCSCPLSLLTLMSLLSLLSQLCRCLCISILHYYSHRPLQICFYLSIKPKVLLTYHQSNLLFFEFLGCILPFVLVFIYFTLYKLFLARIICLKAQRLFSF